MAWRIHNSILRGEIDNRIKDLVSGRIWCFGLEEPLELELRGNPFRDLAGHRLSFTPVNPKPFPLDGLALVQKGVVGDMTASRKVKVPEVPGEEVMRLASAGLHWPWHWGNALYLEWFSERNGRVVIESCDFRLVLSDAAPLWEMDEEMEFRQKRENVEALKRFMDQLGDAGPS